MEVKRVKVENEESRKFPCKLCPYQASRFYCLNKHVIAVHAKIKEHECDKCGVNFSTKSNLTAHVKSVHLKIKNHECEECGAAFSRKFILRRHVKGVHLKIKIKCHLCPMTFTQNGSLKNHIRRKHF